MTTDAVEYGALGANELTGDRRWWEIYEECFPLREEREPPATIIESLRRGTGAAFYARAAGRTIAMARTHVLADTADFLAYIGVTETWRRRGVADTLFRSLPRRLIFEVEDPDHAARYHTTDEVCRQRIRWYQNHFGAVLLEQPYVQPPLMEGAGLWPYRLMWTGPPLTEKQVLDLVRAIYEQFYQRTNGVSGEWIRACLEHVASPRPS